MTSPLTAARATIRYGNATVPDQLPAMGLAAAVKLFAGGIACLTPAGYLTPGAATPGLRCVGISETTVDNSTGAAGDVSAPRIRRGPYLLGNSGTTDAVTAADVGSVCFVVDDQTVARTDGGGARPVAGRVFGVGLGPAGDQVCVELGLGLAGDPRADVEDVLLLAAADLTLLQNTFVKIDTAGKAAAASAAGESCAGVLQNAPDTGAVAIVRVRGESRVYASATIEEGVDVATTNVGKSKAAVALTGDAATVGTAQSAVATADANAGTEAGAGTLANALKAAFNLMVTQVNALRTNLATVQPTTGSFVMGKAVTPGATDTLHTVDVCRSAGMPGTAA